MANSEESSTPAASAQAPTGPLPYRQNAANHIRDLSSVNEKIPDILRTSATAISQLTTRPVIPDPSSSLPRDIDTPTNRKLILQQCSQDLFTSVGEISAALHAQITDLHEAKVIPATQIRYIPPTTRPGQQPVETPRDSEMTVTNGGLGDLDVGILNARAGVRQAGGGEVLDRVRGILETLAKRAQEGEEERMVVDG
ncbi:hypothetical protein K505DRAFT_316962 [Melanomma pulvis-pyrius CBS 109.77]|uniref:Mediator of RNA polymerase II transcription subunit 11 n=1 Tax=Melanomma pulvis-pyrius CBS 109.77 TaxID=1314802 RepID=A0A6A6WTR6_9PLEO|nr:hypothetical protein K505DRAFT_316962 [Melanomma pulvis-pyrius CBS 109.77]